MKYKKKKTSDTKESATPSGKRVGSRRQKTLALPVEPPVSEEVDLYANAPLWTPPGGRDKAKRFPFPRSPDRPNDYAYPLPTAVELLACATAIHGSAPLPIGRNALRELFKQAIVLWREAQDRIEIYSIYLLPFQGKKWSDYPLLFESYEDLVKRVTGLTRDDDARQRFEEWLDSKKPGDPQKEIEFWKREVVGVSRPEHFFYSARQDFSSWYDDRLATTNRENAGLKECYRFISKVTEEKNKGTVRALFEEWKRHEAVNERQTGKGAALLKHLKKTFERWWNEKQADIANGKNAP